MSSAHEKKKEDSVQTEIPEFVSSAGIAKLLGKSVRRIQQITAEGIIQTEKTPGKLRRYNTAETVQRYIEHIEKKQNDDTNGKQALQLKKLQAEIALKESQGELHRLKTDIASGKYLPIETISEDYIKFFTVLKKFLTSLPSRLCSQFMGYIEPVSLRAIEKELNDDITEQLNSFVGYAKEEEGHDSRKKH